MRISGWPARTICPTSTKRLVTLPGTRKPRSLWTRAVTTPVNAGSPPGAAPTATIRTNSGCVLGSCCSCVVQPSRANRKETTMTRPADFCLLMVSSLQFADLVSLLFVAMATLHNQIHFIPEQRTYLPELLIEIEGRTQSGCPPASKRPERTDCRARRGFCGQSEIIFSHEHLTVCIKHIREWYYASFVGLLGKILHPLKRINLSDNLISARL